MAKRLLSRLFCVAFLFALIPASLVPAAVAAGEQELYNFRFDEEAAQGQYFSPAGASAVFEWVNRSGVGHGDDTAIKATHIDGETYKSNENALRLTLPEPLPAGGIYRIVAWVYAPSADNSDKDALTGPGFVLNDLYPGEQGEVKFPVDFGTLPLDEWKGIDVTLPVQSTPTDTLDFRIVINDEPKHPDVWYWDNIEIYQIGDLQEVAAPEEQAVTDEGYPIITRNEHKEYEDFDYELWTQRSSDPVTMILTGGGAYQCEWDALNVLFRTGKKLNSKKTYAEYGNIVMDYGATHTITKGDVNYLCMYGWTEDPMIEFYIIENHGNYKPPGGVGFQGTYEMDGSTYEVYINTRVEQPSIQGTKTFEQYFAVRVDRRTAGTISISDHFKEWDAMGLDMSGRIYDINLCVEGYNSAGSADVYSHVLTIGDETYGVPADVSPTPAATSSAPAITPSETAAPSPSKEPTPDISAGPDDSTGVPSRLPLILGICAAGLVVVGVVIFIVVKKGKSKS